jgi:ABC-type sugar transport system ATPase subunit
VIDKPASVEPQSNAALLNNSEPILKIIGMRKDFPGVQALKGVNIEIFPGEVHCWVGENGAGKSTLIKILAGAYDRSEGSIELNGDPVSFKNPTESHLAGLSFIFQELSVVNTLSVADNILLGNEIHRGPSLSRKSSNLRSKLLLDRIGFPEIDPKKLVGKLSTAQKQAVMIARAIHLDSKIIFMDEPTASLDRAEVIQLFKVIEMIKMDGKSIVYVSHRLDEVNEIADRVTVLKDGLVVANHLKGEFTPDQLVSEMVGREITETFPPKVDRRGDVVLSVKGISTDKIRDVTFDLHAGEIVGVAGLVGAGRTELLQALYGIDQIAEGLIYLDGAILTIRNTRDAINAGIALVPEDRRGQGIVARRSVEENLTLAWAGRVGRGIHWQRNGRTLTESFIERLRIKTSSVSQLIGNLSGGNQQKIVIARWLATKPKVLLLDEPTRGVDVGAKSELFWIMSELAASGVAILMVSSEISEILGLANRVLVMRGGSLVAELGGETTEEEILTLALTRERQEIQ